MYQLTGSEVWSGGIPGSDPRPPLDRSVQGPWVDPLEREGVGGYGVEGGGGEEKKRGREATRAEGAGVGCGGEGGGREGTSSGEGGCGGGKEFREKGSAT